MWLGQIERKTGQDKDSLHYEFKKRFLIYIYRRDDQDFAEFRGLHLEWTEHEPIPVTSDICPYKKRQKQQQDTSYPQQILIAEPGP